MATRRDLFTNEAQMQFDYLMMGLKAGAIDPSSAMQALMAITSDPSYTTKGRMDIEKQKEKERILADLQLAEALGQKDKVRAIKLKMLGPEAIEKLKRVANYKPSATEKIAGWAAGYKKGGLAGGYRGYKNPMYADIAMSEDVQDRSRGVFDPRSYMDASKFLWKQNLGLGEEGDYAFSPDLMNLADQYLQPNMQGGYGMPDLSYDTPLSSFYGEPNSYLK